jgi:hypothetical protein
MALQYMLEREFDDVKSEDYAPELKAILDACYRPIKRAVALYYGEDSPLSYCAPPPGKPFAKAK